MIEDKLLSKTKCCNSCESDKFLYEFGKLNSSLDGRRATCKKCRRLLDYKNKEKNPDLHKSRGAKNAENYAKRDPLRFLIQRCKSNHKRKGFIEPFILTKEDLEEVYLLQDGKCYWTGIPISLDSILSNSPDSISIDRIDTEIGYTKDNICITNRFINLGRGDYGAEDFIKFLDRFKSQL